jgi:hypothetical protein
MRIQSKGPLSFIPVSLETRGPARGQGNSLPLRVDSDETRRPQMAVRETVPCFCSNAGQWNFKTLRGVDQQALVRLLVLSRF